MKINDTINRMFLKNAMEAIQWGNAVLPIKVYLHLGDHEAYVMSHWHKELEITCMLSGEAISYVRGKRYIIKAGEVGIINSEDIHHFNYRVGPSNEKISGITLQINYDFLKMLIPELDTLYFIPGNQVVQGRLLDRICHIFELYTQEDAEKKRIRIYSAVCELMADLYELCSEKRDMYPESDQKNIRQCKMIIDYINKHFTEDLRQKEIADQFHYSREYLSRLFKKQTGMTVKEYIMYCRIKKTTEDLESTDKTISDIASGSGFSSESHFISCFKVFHGVTPLQYRKNRKMNE